MNCLTQVTQFQGSVTKYMSISEFEDGNKKKLKQFCHYSGI